MEFPPKVWAIVVGVEKYMGVGGIKSWDGEMCGCSSTWEMGLSVKFWDWLKDVENSCEGISIICELG